MNVLSLFSGIGGLDLGLERAGMSVVGQVEVDSWCQQVLKRHWPEVPRHDRAETAVEWWRSSPWRPRVDVVAGGFPCQPVSNIGLGQAQADPRWLWPLMRDIIAAIRPRWVIAENVPGLRLRGLVDVLRDLRDLGYWPAAGSLSACEVGAPHSRQRLYILAYAEGHDDRHERQDGPGPRAVPAWREVQVHAGGGSRAVDAGRWPAEPRLGRVADGIPGRVDRLKALGNAVPPQVGEYIGRLVMESG
jgi:DNA (cytosine-5)-methyltransferase 1